MPLRYAAENGNEAVVKLLLEMGQVEADSKDRKNRTPLLCAARNGHEAVVKLLLETGQVEGDSKDLRSDATIAGHLEQAQGYCQATAQVC